VGAGHSWQPDLRHRLDMTNSSAVAERLALCHRVLAPYDLSAPQGSLSNAWHMMGFIIEGRPSGRDLDTSWLLTTLTRPGLSTT
jgi:hypothetical protein